MNYNTKQRQLIIDTLKNNKNKSFSAKELFLLLKDNVSKATLYRTIDELASENKINKYFNSNENRFEYQISLDERTCNYHLHMKCLICGKVYHLSSIVNKAINDVASDFKVDFSCSLITGKCKECVGR